MRLPSTDGDIPVRASAYQPYPSPAIERGFLYKTVAGRLLHVLVAVLAGLGALFVIATITPLVSWWGRALAGSWNDPHGEVLIVLRGFSTNDGLIGGSSYWRSGYAVFAYREGWVRQIIITGGSKTATPRKLHGGASCSVRRVPRDRRQRGRLGGVCSVTHISAHTFGWRRTYNRYLSPPYAEQLLLGSRGPLFRVSTVA